MPVVSLYHLNQEKFEEKELERKKIRTWKKLGIQFSPWDLEKFQNLEKF